MLRPLTAADQLLLQRLERHRAEAFAACARRLQQLELDATLIDVEHLFDESSLFFYFLGPITPEIESLTEELAELYAAEVEFHRVSEVLTQGCGCDCGSGTTSCGSSCDSCSLAQACRVR